MTDQPDQYGWAGISNCHTNKHTSTERGVVAELSRLFEQSPLPLSGRLQSFPRHIRRQDISRFIARYELFKMMLPVNGSIVECGVFAGAGLMTWMHLSSIFEPYNHLRRVIGFDTFEGFPSVHEKDFAEGASEHLHEGALSTHASMYEELQALAAIHDQNRPLGHIPKVHLVKGDATKTVPQFVEDNPHMLISLLYLDYDIYEPTKVSLEALYPRVVKGGLVVFDELNTQEFPGETVALMEFMDLKDAEIKRFPYDPHMSYFIK
ncbi:MAG: hypothetical protein OHK0046_24440 [Anaerolineae bacterium]